MQWQPQYNGANALTIHQLDRRGSDQANSVDGDFKEAIMVNGGNLARTLILTRSSMGF